MHAYDVYRTAKCVYKCALRSSGCEVLYGCIDTDLTSSGLSSKTIPRVDREECSTFWDRMWSTGTGLISRIESFFVQCRDKTLSARTSPAPEHRQ